MLTAAAIKEAVENGDIVIDDFSEERLNPNSYNLRLSPKLLRYTSNTLDMFQNNPTEEITITDHGYILRPGEFYLGSTIEGTYTPKHIPCIDGRSSIARLGIFVHVTAGFGDIGFDGTWTLEIFVIHPLRIYPYDEIGQVSFETVTGDASYQYNGRYNHQKDVTESRFYQNKLGEYKDDE